MNPITDFTQAMLLLALQRPFAVDGESYDGIRMLDGGEKPSLQELQTAWDAHVEAVAAGNTIRAQLAADYAALPSGVQVAFNMAFNAVREKLIAGNISGAKAIITSFPVPSDYEAARTQMLSHFP